jgi:uncharacterized membrane protein YbhN (UPF0104 family)
VGDASSSDAHPQHEVLDAVSDSLHALDEAETPATAKKKPSWKSRVLTGIRIVIALAIVYYLGRTTISEWSNVRETFHTLSWPALIASQLAVLIAVGANMMAFRAALADVDHKLPVRTAAPIMLVGQLGKYLPGSVWAYVMQMDLARRAGVPRTRAFVSSLVSTGLGITVGLVFGAFGLRTALDGAKDDNHGSLARIAFFAALVLLPFALVCAHPKVLTRLVQLMLKLLRRPPLDRPLTWRGVLEPAGWSTLSYVLVGTHLWFLAPSGTAPGFNGWLRCIGVMALAISVSVFVVIAPSGIGVREFLIQVALGGGSIAFGIALASRLLFTIADLAGAGLASAVGAHRLRSRPETVSPPDSALQPEAAPQPDSAS